MADVTLPNVGVRTSWLDRPILPTWQRLAALSINWELTAYGALLFLGFIMRIWDVGSQAMHHDESVHAWLAWNLYNGTGYHYDPIYHGPLQFEVVALFYVLFGDNEFSARLLAVLLGSAIIVLPYFLRPYLTKPGALLASVMLTISPVFLFYSRFIRDDIYLAFFSLLLFVCLVRYLQSPSPPVLYVASAAMALAMASMEAAYITFFIFGSFLVFALLRERLLKQPGPVLPAIRDTSLDTWLTAASIFVVLTVVFFSTFFSNPYGIWDPQHSICLSGCFSLHPTWNPDRKDILGGITYWLVQHKVERGGQPWFYYFLVLPLYEQLALVFGIAGIIYAAVRRSLVSTFLVWWALLALAIYSWAGEKMPWLSMHIALPFILLAGLALGASFSSGRPRLSIAAGVTFLVLLLLEIHSALLLSYVNGANPTEMLLYVQTSQDVPRTVHEVDQLSLRTKLGTKMPIGLDNSDVVGWPFVWYLRHYTSVSETSVFNGPACNGQYCPVLLMLGPEYDKYGSQLTSHYVAQKYRWDWWFPEDYKTWFPQHCGAVAPSSSCQLSQLGNLLGSSSDWNHIWSWLIYRKPFGDRAARWLYVLVRRDLVPGAKYFPTHPAATAPRTANKITPLPAIQDLAFGSGAGSGRLYGPRGIAASRDDRVYVADTLNHRVVEFSSTGGYVRAWGKAGTSRVEFSSNASPQSLAIAPNGDVVVADTWNQRIVVFSKSGKLLRTWGGEPIGAGPGQFYGPRSIAVSPSGTVYVADTGNKRIQVFSSNGKYLRSWGKAGSAPGEFNEPSSVAIGPSGQVYVSDFWNRRIQVFSPSGHFVRSWSVPDWIPQSYDEPYLAVDQPSGRIYATDPANQQVLAYTGTGHLIGAFGAGRLQLPIGIAAESGNRIAVADATSNQVVVFSVHSSHRSVTNRAGKTSRPVKQAKRKR